MKKIFFFLSAIAIVSLTSCSGNDDDSSTNPTPDPSTSVLPKRVVWQEEDPDGFNYDITYTYNGNKLIQGNHINGDIDRYFYSGDLITKIEYLYDGEVEDQELFEYDSTGRLVLHKYQEIAEDWQERSVFVYNTDGTVTQKYYTESLTVPSTNPLVSVLTFVNGEMTKVAQQGYSTYNYSYDGKNSPFKNVTGYAAIAYAAHGDYEVEGKSQNISNITNETESYTYMSNTIQYNATNYPTQITSVGVFFDDPSQTNQLILKYYYE